MPPLTLAILSFLTVAAPADDPAAAARAESRFRSDEREHWAFRSVQRPELSQVRNVTLVRTPFDAFVLSRLERAGLPFASPASKRELIRRATFDLIGLPPTPQEIAEFLADDRPDAYERLIDRLLASPHYGEHWGRYWLDLVRFADTAGYKADPLRPLAYKYRDYVIRAFNRDTPYDRFIREQLAGDELFPGDAEAIIATGYNRLWPDESNASNILLARQDALNDLTSNVGSVFLGLSLGCAQCHDHKFDPILQTDFYRLQAFFAGIVPADRVPLGTPDQLVAYGKEYETWLTATAAARSSLHTIERTARAKAGHEKRLKFPAVVLDAIDTAPQDRTSFQQQLAFWSERQIEVDEKQMLAKMTDDQKRQRDELKDQLAAMLKRQPDPPASIDAMAVLEPRGGAPATHLLAGGSYDKPLAEVQPGFLSVIEGTAGRSAAIVPPRPDTTGRRATLAQWLTDPANPLVARVMVNRIWQGHFGRGLVENANDFGTQTPPPVHPELLDWLAAEFVARGWSIKELHRLIMTSAVYRQSSEHRDATQTDEPAAQVDAGAETYRHFPRRRLTAESTRDAMLAVAGALNTRMFGPGVRPELPPHYTSYDGWELSKSEGDRNRRAVYILAKRNLPYPLLDAFDFPDMHESCARRAVTTTAPQGLMLLNSDLVLGFARGFADRLLADDPETHLSVLVRRAYALAFAREPTQEEVRAASQFITEQQELIARRLRAGEAADIPRGWPKFTDPARAAAIVDFCHALFNANEFVYVD